VLKRKPKVGEIVTSHTGVRHRVTGFHSTQPSICMVEEADNPDPPDTAEEDKNCFIWSFEGDILNWMFSHEEE